MYLSFYLSRLQDTVKHSFFKAVSHGVGKKDVRLFEGINHKAAGGCYFMNVPLSMETSHQKKKKKYPGIPQWI